MNPKGVKMLIYVWVLQRHDWAIGSGGHEVTASVGHGRVAHDSPSA
jgi:hypothetical protein